MTKVDMMRAALRELGEVSAEQLALFIRQQYGAKIEPKFIPVLRASVRDRDLLESFRERVRAAAGPCPPGSPPDN